MESYKRMRTPFDVDCGRSVVREGIPDDIERRRMRLEIHNRRCYIAPVLTPGGVEARVNAKLLAGDETKFGMRGHVPSGEASAVSLGVKAKLENHRHTVDILYRIG